MSDLYENIVSVIPGAVPQELVTGWIVFVETIDADGARALHFEHSDGMKAWSYLGILEYAKNVELASAVKDDD